MWFSGARGAARFDGKNISAYQNDADNPFSLPEGYISDILLTKNNRLWFATPRGLYEFEFERERFVRHPLLLDGQDIAEHIWALTEDSQGLIWMGTLKRGVATYDPSSKRYEEPPGFSGANNTDTGSINAILAGSNNRLWWGGDFGLYSYDFESKHYKHYNPEEGSCLLYTSPSPRD